MAKDKKAIVETAAADTLHPAAQAIEQPDSRTSKLSAVIGQLATLDTTSLTSIFDQVMAKAAEIGHGPGVGNVAGSNAATLNMKPSAASSSPSPAAMAHAVSAAAVKEDMTALFAGTELSEDFQAKTYTLFESVVNARVATQIAEAEELMVQEVTEFKEQLETELSDKLDSYLDYVAEAWMQENEVAIVAQLRADMTEDFVNGLKNLFAEHFVEMPEEKVDAIEALTAELAEAEQRLGEMMDEVTALRESVEQNTIGVAFDEVSEGLVMTQVEKLRTLCEGITTDGTVEDYKKKVSIIKEKHFPPGKPSNVAPQTIVEEVDGAAGGELNESVAPTGSMARYARAISTGVKR